MPASAIGLLVIGGSLVGGVVCASLAGFAFRRRDVPAAIPFGGLMVAAGLWSVADAGALLAEDAETVTALLTTADVAAAGIAPLWVAFALAYTGLDRYRRPAVYAVLWAVPIGYAGLIVTAPLHGIVDLSVEFRTVAGVTAPTLVRGLPYWVNVAVAYLLVFVGYVALVGFLSSARPVYRTQTAAIVGGSLLPLVGNAIFVVGIGAETGLDPTPLAVALGGVIAGWALFRSDVLSVTPLASDLLIDELPDPVLVLDSGDRIVDHNDAATAAFGGGRLVGRGVETVTTGLLDRVASGELIRGTDPDDHDGRALFEPRITEITDPRGERRGRLIVLRDVTVQQRRMDRVEALQATTERLIEARIDDEVAEVAVSFVERVLGQEVAVVFLAADGRLRPAAVSSVVADAVDGDLREVTAETTSLFEQYETGESGVLTGSDLEWGPFETVLDVDDLLVLSLGEHGLLCLASRDGAAYSAEDRQFATILAGATETALDRVVREQQLRKSRRVVRHRTEQLEFLNGVLRHNIRNGAQVIDSNAQLLAGTLEGSDRERIDRIRERSTALSELTETIRSITETLTSDGQRVWPVDVGPTLSTAIDRLDAEYDFTVDGNLEDDRTVLANDLLADVFEDVVRNAVEHEDGSATIEVDVRPMGEWLQVRIADEGPGVSDHLKESLFERDVSVSQTAHGFGLYFVALMMDLYGGDVWFEDNDPTGAIAVLEFQRPSTRA